MSSDITQDAVRQANQRFASIVALYDLGTFRALEATGVSPGWRCLEVGGGSGSVAAWLGRQVGPTGQVIVTEIDDLFLTALTALNQPNFEVQRHDIGADPLPEGAFDLIHARLVLQWVPARHEALRRIVAALKPGGWVVIEEYEPLLTDRGFPTRDAADAALYQKMVTAQVEFLSIRGGEEGWGRNLYQRLRDHGLVDVGMSGHLEVWLSGSIGAQLDRGSYERMREQVVSAGFVTQEEVEQVLALLDAPNFAVSSPVMLTAWGRRPSD